MLHKSLMVVASWLEPRARKADRLLRLLAEEMASKAPLPFWQRLRALWRGYLSQSVLMYPMNAENRHLFVTDYQRCVRTPDINGEYRLLVKDKLLFNLMTQLFPDLHIPAHGVIHEGALRYARASVGTEPLRHLMDLLEQRGRLVLKPIVGGGGWQLSFLARRGNAVLINEQAVDESRLRAWLGRLRHNMISDFVPQCPELAALYPRTTNTVRLLTMWDPATDEPFGASAVLRIGNAASYPVDNGMAGGFAAAIDLESGKIGKALSFPRKDKPVSWYSAHPETGERIEGLFIPHWQRIIATMMEVCRRIPYLRYVGWDIIVTANGFRLVEGNHFPGLYPNQAQGPLLADARIARFYRAHGVI